LHQKTPSAGRVFFDVAAHPSAGIIRIRFFGSDCASLSALRLPVISIGNLTTMEVVIPFFDNIFVNFYSLGSEDTRYTDYYATPDYFGAYLIIILDILKGNIRYR